MPSYYNDDFINDEQDWDEIKWKDLPSKVNNKGAEESENKSEELSFNKQLFLARKKAYYTINRLSQTLGIKVKELEMYENGTKIPNNITLKKINKILNSKLEIINDVK